jgi:hypothetical protein
MVSPGASPGQRLRELIEAPGILVMPGIYDGFSARLVEAAGFNALMGLPQLRELEGRYLSTADREREYGGRA